LLLVTKTSSDMLESATGKYYVL